VIATLIDEWLEQTSIFSRERPDRVGPTVILGFSAGTFQGLAPT
jgi:hypothetical protein